MKRDKKTTKSLSKISYNLLPENYDYINKELEKFNNTMNKIVDTYFDLSTESIKGLINSLEHNLNNIVKEVQIPDEVPIISPEPINEPIIEIIKKAEVKVKKIRFNEKVD